MHELSQILFHGMLKIERLKISQKQWPSPKRSEDLGSYPESPPLSFRPH